MRAYKCLLNQVFRNGKYSIVPIRDEDKYLIMQWRNEQIYHLRQNTPLTVVVQEEYFKNTISSLFHQDRPNQLLFSYMEDDDCIGYGGLVHINWIDKHAEISFIINTELEKKYFEFHWITYLSLIEKVAFEDLFFHKIFTYAFDLRPHLYKAVLKSGFVEEGRLKEHCLFNGQFIDVLIHSKINNSFHFRKANINDLLQYYEWANDEQVRLESYKSQKINIDIHTSWFVHKLNDKRCFLYLCENQNNIPIGQVRIEKQLDEKKAIIGLSIDKKFRGKGIASIILKGSISQFALENPNCIIDAYIKKTNTKSRSTFIAAGFHFVEELEYEGSESYIFRIKI